MEKRKKAPETKKIPVLLQYRRDPISLSGLTIIVHYLPGTRKPEFVACNALYISGVISEGVNLFTEFGVIFLQRNNIVGKGEVLHLHAIIFYQAHFSEEKRRNKIDAEGYAGRRQQFLSAVFTIGDACLEIISPSHGFGILAGSQTGQAGTLSSGILNL